MRTCVGGGGGAGGVGLVGILGRYHCMQRTREITSGMRVRSWQVQQHGESLHPPSQCVPVHTYTRAPSSFQSLPLHLTLPSHPLLPATG